MGLALLLVKIPPGDRKWRPHLRVLDSQGRSPLSPAPTPMRPVVPPGSLSNVSTFATGAEVPERVCQSVAEWVASQSLFQKGLVVLAWSRGAAGSAGALIKNNPVQV